VRHAGTVRVYAVRLSERASSALMAFLRSRCKARTEETGSEESAAFSGNECMRRYLGDASKRTPRKSERPSTPRRADDSPDDSQLHSPQTLRRETTDLIHRDRHARCRYGPISDIHDMEKRCNMLQDTRNDPASG
jgi:hypothetical protein